MLAAAITTGEILIGLALLVSGGELLVRGAVKLAETFKLSPLLIGLTVVAFGTSAPELGVSLQATLSGNPDVAIGNIVGSNIFNVLLVLGAAAVVKPLVVSSQLIRWELPLMFGSSLVMWLMAADGKFSRNEGMILLAMLAGYLLISICRQRQVSRKIDLDEKLTHDFPMGKLQFIVNFFCLLAGFFCLTLGSRFLVSGATQVAVSLGVSTLVIGLTVVAIGTSLPEGVASIVACYRGQREIAIGNVVGSNLFNILCVLGLTASISPTSIVVPEAAIWIDIPIMVAVAGICIPLFMTGGEVTRIEGLLLLGCFVGYICLIVNLVTSTDQSNQHLTKIYCAIIVATAMPFIAWIFERRRVHVARK